MYMHVYMYMYVYGRICMYLYVYNVYVWICMNMYVYMYMHVYTYMHVFPLNRNYIWKKEIIFGKKKHICMYMQYMYVYVCICVYMYAWTSITVYARIWCICTYFVCISCIFWSNTNQHSNCCHVPKTQSLGAAISGPESHILSYSTCFKDQIIKRLAYISSRSAADRKDLTSFQIANGGGRRHLMRVRAGSGLNPGPLGS